MSTSYKLSESVNFQTVLWAGCRATVGAVRSTCGVCRRLSALVRHYVPLALSGVLWALAVAYGVLLAVCDALRPALPHLAVCVAFVGAVVFAATFPVVAGCIAIIVIFGFVTYPKAGK